MEQDIDYFFENQTNSTEPYSRPTIYVAQEILQTIFCLIGFFSDLVIIFIMVKSQRMRTRTNLIILNWAITDALFVITTPGFLSLILQHPRLKTHEAVYCAIENLDILYQFGSFVLIFCLMSTSIIKTKRIVDHVFFGVFYGIMVFVFLLNTGFCLAGNYMTLVFHHASFYGMLVVVFCLIFKEFNNCWRVCRKNPLSQATMFRLNFVRIYVYTWTVCGIIYTLSHNVRIHNYLIFFYLFCFMASFFLVCYMAVTDRNFKICILNLMRCKWSEYSVDVTISFADECSEENAAANITFNGANSEVRKRDFQV